MARYMNEESLIGSELQTKFDQRLILDRFPFGILPAVPLPVLMPVSKTPDRVYAVGVDDQLRTESIHRLDDSGQFSLLIGCAIESPS